MKSLADRFWAKVDKNGPKQPHMKTQCWIWKGALRNGYGAIGAGRKVLYAHRLSYELAHGAAPSDCATHRCDHRACVRPSHLKDGTKKFNSQDMVQKGRAATGDRHGMRKHPQRVPRGERSGTARLDWVKVKEVRAKYPTISAKQLSEDYDVSLMTIYKVVRNETWKQ